MIKEPEELEDLPPVRLCTIRKWPDFDGYGFSLQFNTQEEQEFIGSVDDDSPAEAGGLRKGDRVVEVNGMNVEGRSHAYVVDQIKSNPSQTTFLVVDPEADLKYSNRGVRILATLKTVHVMETPMKQPGAEVVLNVAVSCMAKFH